MTFNCPKCGTHLECLGGCSAHPDNWYCPNCNYEAWKSNKADGSFSWTPPSRSVPPVQRNGIAGSTASQSVPLAGVRDKVNGGSAVLDPFEEVW